MLCFNPDSLLGAKGRERGRGGEGAAGGGKGVGRGGRDQWGEDEEESREEQ